VSSAAIKMLAQMSVTYSITQIYQKWDFWVIILFLALYNFHTIFHSGCANLHSHLVYENTLHNLAIICYFCLFDVSQSTCGETFSVAGR
jgi:hypothetical protein